MRSILLLVSAVIAYFSAFAQQPTGGFGAGSPLVQQPCLAPAEHAEVAQYVQQKLRLLKTPNARKPAARPSFRWPVQLAKPSSAFTPFVLTNFVDHSPTLGPAEVNQFTTYNLDYQCGNRTYNQSTGYRHAGVDISLQPFDWETMAQEVVSVVAAAPGVIITKTDGYDDQSCGSFASGGQWNAVYIRHDDGSVAWYGHLKRGSLTVKRTGERVEEGELLGYVGSSGRSSGPHLHFEVYDAANKLIDPFVGACNKTITESWWKQQPDYASKGINRSSIHLTRPVQYVCPPSANRANETAFVKPGQLVYFYTYGWNMAVGDSIRFELIGPTGPATTLVNTRATNIFRTFFWWQSATLPATTPVGTYTFRVRFGQRQYDHVFAVTNTPETALTVTPGKAVLQCANDSTLLTASLKSPALQWRRNGTLLNSPIPGQLMARDSGTYTAELLGQVSAGVRLTKQAAQLIKPTVSQSGLTLTSSLTANNQWLRNDVPVPGATGQTFTVTESGRYRVQNQQPCGAPLSDAVEVVILGLETPDTDVVVWPNPATTECQVRWAASLQPTHLTLVSVTGQTIRNQPVTGQSSAWLPLHDLPGGTYLIGLQSTVGTWYGRRVVVHH
jgi:murein DD-endopeptidase MepM/ murein hydrolase activator NlpD